MNLILSSLRQPAKIQIILHIAERDLWIFPVRSAKNARTEKYGRRSFQCWAGSANYTHKV